MFEEILKNHHIEIVKVIDKKTFDALNDLEVLQGIYGLKLATILKNDEHIVFKDKEN